MLNTTSSIKTCSVARQVSTAQLRCFSSLCTSSPYTQLIRPTVGTKYPIGRPNLPLVIMRHYNSSTSKKLKAKLNRITQSTNASSVVSSTRGKGKSPSSSANHRDDGENLHFQQDYRGVPFNQIPVNSLPYITFTRMGVASHIWPRLHESGFRQPTAIQLAGLPHLLPYRAHNGSYNEREHRDINPSNYRSYSQVQFPSAYDVLLQDMTGSGKTLAYGIPLLQSIDLRTDTLQAIIVQPTRELCIQVYQQLHQLAQSSATTHGEVKLMRCNGATNGRMLKALADRPPHILITTPKTLAELLRSVTSEQKDKLKSRRRGRTTRTVRNTVEHDAEDAPTKARRGKGDLAKDDDEYMILRDDEEELMTEKARTPEGRAELLRQLTMRRDLEKAAKAGVVDSGAVRKVTGKPVTEEVVVMQEQYKRDPSRGAVMAEVDEEVSDVDADDDVEIDAATEQRFLEDLHEVDNVDTVDAEHDIDEVDGAEDASEWESNYEEASSETAISAPKSKRTLSARGARRGPSRAAASAIDDDDESGLTDDELDLWIRQHEQGVTVDAGDTDVLVARLAMRMGKKTDAESDAEETAPANASFTLADALAQLAARRDRDRARAHAHLLRVQRKWAKYNLNTYAQERSIVKQRMKLRVGLDMSKVRHIVMDEADLCVSDSYWGETRSILLAALQTRKRQLATGMVGLPKPSLIFPYHALPMRIIMCTATLTPQLLHVSAAALYKPHLVSANHVTARKSDLVSNYEQSATPLVGDVENDVDADEDADVKKASKNKPKLHGVLGDKVDGGVFEVVDKTIQERYRVLEERLRARYSNNVAEAVMAGTQAEEPSIDATDVDVKELLNDLNKYGLLSMTPGTRRALALQRARVMPPTIRHYYVVDRVPEHLYDSQWELPRRAPPLVYGQEERAKELEAKGKTGPVVKYEGAETFAYGSNTSRTDTAANTGKGRKGAKDDRRAKDGKEEEEKRVQTMPLSRQRHDDNLTLYLKHVANVIARMSAALSPRCMLVFVNNSKHIEELAQACEAKRFRVGVLVGDSHKKYRKQVLHKVHRGELNLVLSTSMGGRGVDWRGVTCVVNYGCPSDEFQYIHRAGRVDRMKGKQQHNVVLTVLEDTGSNLYVNPAERLTEIATAPVRAASVEAVHDTAAQVEEVPLEEVQWAHEPPLVPVAEWRVLRGVRGASEASVVPAVVNEGMLVECMNGRTVVSNWSQQREMDRMFDEMVLGQDEEMDVEEAEEVDMEMDAEESEWSDSDVDMDVFAEVRGKRGVEDVDEDVSENEDLSEGDIDVDVDIEFDHNDFDASDSEVDMEVVREVTQSKRNATTTPDSSTSAPVFTRGAPPMDTEAQRKEALRAVRESDYIQVEDWQAGQPYVAAWREGEDVQLLDDFAELDWEAVEQDEHRREEKRKNKAAKREEEAAKVSRVAQRAVAAVEENQWKQRRVHELLTDMGISQGVLGKTDSSANNRQKKRLREQREDALEQQRLVREKVDREWAHMQRAQARAERGKHTPGVPNSVPVGTDPKAKKASMKARQALSALMDEPTDTIPTASGYKKKAAADTNASNRLRDGAAPTASTRNTGAYGKVTAADKAALTGTPVSVTAARESKRDGAKFEKNDKGDKAGKYDKTKFDQAEKNDKTKFDKAQKNDKYASKSDKNASASKYDGQRATDKSDSQRKMPSNVTFHSDSKRAQGEDVSREQRNKPPQRTKGFTPMPADSTAYSKPKKYAPGTSEPLRDIDTLRSLPTSALTEREKAWLQKNQGRPGSRKMAAMYGDEDSNHGYMQSTQSTQAYSAASSQRAPRTSSSARQPQRVADWDDDDDYSPKSKGGEYRGPSTFRVIKKANVETDNASSSSSAGAPRATTTTSAQGGAKEKPTERRDEEPVRRSGLSARKVRRSTL